MAKHKLVVKPREYNLRSKKRYNTPTATLDRLPKELLRDIYLMLETPAMLAFKLVCKALNGITLDRNGRNVVDIKPKDNVDDVFYWFYAMLIKIETEVPANVPLERLTSGAERDGKDNWVENGFPDEEFERKRLNRTCLECLDVHGEDDYYHVHGERYSQCESPDCVSRPLYHGPRDRPSEKVLRAFIEDPDEVYQTSRQEHDFEIIPRELCLACFLLETRKAAMQHLNATI